MITEPDDRARSTTLTGRLRPARRADQGAAFLAKLAGSGRVLRVAIWRRGFGRRISWQFEVLGGGRRVAGGPLRELHGSAGSYFAGRSGAFRIVARPSFGVEEPYVDVELVAPSGGEGEPQ
jgi:hypothetical protein